MGSIYRRILLLFITTMSLMFFQNCGQLKSVENSDGSENLFSQNGQLEAADFVETGANFSLEESNSLFDFDNSTGVLMISTSSNLDNIHSHYADGSAFGNYTYSGSMMASDSASGIGVTFLSGYPASDDYYRLANDSGTGSFQLSARNSTACQGLDSGIVPQPGEWYSFKILVNADSNETTMQVKVWPSFSREPFDVQLSCVDSSANRRVQGTIGLWASGTGDKNWGDLFVGFDPYVAPSVPTPPPTTPPVTPPPSTPQDCGNIPHGQSETRTRYQSQTVPFGSTCVSEDQTRTCDDGRLSPYAPNNYQFDSCTVDPAPPTPPPTTPPVTPPAPDQDGDGIPDSSDPCPNDPQNNCQTGTPIANASELNTAIASASGGEVFLLAPGNYGRLTIKNRNYSSKVTIKSAVPMNPASFSQLRVSGSSQVILDGLYFDYTYAAGNRDHHNVFSVYTSNNIQIMNSTFDGDVASGTNSFRDGFGIGRGVIISTSNQVDFINNEIRKFWKGITMGNGGNYRFIGNDIHTIRSDGFNSGSVDGIKIEKNYFHDFKSAANSPDHRDMIQILRSSGNDSRNIDIRNNIFDMAAGDYAQVIWSGTDGTGAQVHDVLVEGNIIYNAHANGIAFHNVVNMTIRKNTMIRVPRSQTGGVTIPKIGSTGSNIVVDRNVIHGIITRNAIESNNVFIQDTNPSGQGFFDNEFIYHAKAATDGYNEFGIKPGSQIEALDAGSDIMKLYPIGKANTINVLRTLP